MSEPRPIIYLRAAMGGREDLWAQEHLIRKQLESVGVSTLLMHVYSDVDSPGDRVGGALGWILQEAAMRSVGTVVLRDFSRLGRDADMVLRILGHLERREATVLLVREILVERGLEERPRCTVGQQARCPIRPLVATRDSEPNGAVALMAHASM